MAFLQELPAKDHELYRRQAYDRLTEKNARHDENQPASSGSRYATQ